MHAPDTAPETPTIAPLRLACRACRVATGEPEQPTCLTPCVAPLRDALADCLLGLGNPPELWELADDAGYAVADEVLVVLRERGLLL